MTRLLESKRHLPQDHLLAVSSSTRHAWEEEWGPDTPTLMGGPVINGTMWPRSVMAPGVRSDWGGDIVQAR